MKHQYEVIINGEEFPFITQNEWGNNIIRTDILEQMLCKVVRFKIKLWHGSRITGKGTFVYGAGGNKDHIIIVIDDREMNRKSDIRFTFNDIIWNMECFELEVLE